MKINSNLVTKALITVTLTLAIIAAGIGVPGLLIHDMTSSSKLPNGVRDIASIQPYGVEILEREETILNAADNFVYEYLQGDNDLRTVTKTNQYAEIGVQNSLYDGTGSGRPEFTYGVIEIVENYFPGAVPVSYYAQGMTFQPGVNEGTDAPSYIHVFNDSNDIFMDSETGIPFWINLTIVTTYDCDPISLIPEINRLYADYIGVSITDGETELLYTDGYRDTNYACRSTSADGKFVITSLVQSGWYFTPPNYSGDMWHETDMYEWNISVYISRNTD